MLIEARVGAAAVRAQSSRDLLTVVDGPTPAGRSRPGAGCYWLAQITPQAHHPVSIRHPTAAATTQPIPCVLRIASRDSFRLRQSNWAGRVPVPCPKGRSLLCLERAAFPAFCETPRDVPRHATPTGPLPACPDPGMIWEGVRLIARPNAECAAQLRSFRSYPSRESALFANPKGI